MRSVIQANRTVALIDNMESFTCVYDMYVVLEESCAYVINMTTRQLGNVLHGCGVGHGQLLNRIRLSLPS